MHILNRKTKGMLISFLLLLVLLLLPISPVWAKDKDAFDEGTGTVYIHLHENIYKPDDIGKSPDKKGEAISGVKFWIWKLKDLPEMPDDYSKTLSKLDGLRFVDLSRKYGARKLSPPTDSEGLAKISGLPDGLFYMRGTIKDGNQIYSMIFQLPYEGDREIHIYPKQPRPQTVPGTLKIIKEGKKGQALSGAGFKIFKKSSFLKKEGILINTSTMAFDELNGKLSPTLYTDKNGEIKISNLPPGEYIAEEVEAPAGYQLLEDPVYFSVRPNQTASKKILNYPNETGGYHFLKYANDSEKSPVEGAEFQLYQRKNGSWKKMFIDGEPFILRSASDGIFEVKGLAFGRYALEETKAPSGYIKLDYYIPFEVTEKSYDEGRYIAIENEPDEDNPPPGLSPSAGGNPPAEKSNPAKKFKIPFFDFSPPATGDVLKIAIPIILLVALYAYYKSRKKSKEETK